MPSSLTQPEDAVPERAPTAASAWRRLDPRRHFAAALGWSVFALVVAGALLAAQRAASEAERHVEADTRLRLNQLAAQAADALMAQVQVRLAAMQATAAQWRLDVVGDVRPDDRLRALQQQQPELSWIGVRDTAGRLRHATDGEDAAGAAAELPWLQRGTRAPLLALHRSRDANSPSALVLAAPLAPARAEPSGLLEARLPWLWLQAELDARVRAMSGGAPIELVLLDPAGRVLAGPPTLSTAMPAQDLSEGGRYLTGVPPESTPAGAPPVAAGWRVVVREDADRAMAHARQTQRAVLSGVIGVGFLVALAVVAVAHRLLRRLDRLAQQARAVQAGTRTTIDVPGGRDEVHAIGLALARLIGHLQSEKAALSRLNAELDARVAARTERIERLADEARHAAVTRERLRLARGLHDTLAHSLMALLTQIRLVRKLHPGWSRGQLDAELAEAEQAAAAGLAEARAAIGQMRQQGVHDNGLGPELQTLLQRFAERSGVQVQADIDARAGELVDEHAATVLDIAREALRNVEHHAQAHRLRLRLAPEHGSSAGRADAVAAPPRAELEPWQLEIVDDGIGFDPGAVPDGHYGLLGLREQAAQLGAALEIDSGPGRGCRLGLRFRA
jgi:signal transduction histidine kinase